MRFLDLFSGTHSVGTIAQEMGYEVTSLDLADATICCDVLKWDYQKFPVGHFDVIWSSPPCETFSTVRRSNIGRNGYTKESLEQDMLERGVPILRKTEEILAYFQPPLWFIENPQTGKMKDFIDPLLPYYDVDYCKYSDWGYRKRTRIWTNQTGFIPRVCHKNCGYVENGRHVRDVTGSAKNRPCAGQGGGSNRKPRYRIPAPLIRELLSPPNTNDAPVHLHQSGQQQQP